MALGPMFLSEKISLGMIVGVIIMVAGLYAILWANSKDQVSSKTVRDAGEQELPVNASTLGANAKHTCQSNVVDNSTSIEEGQRQGTEHAV
ncbi:WAT1-related protein At4g08300-like [Phalaenopsis equestris]|uniref:WAT1-related protein At4g08300-like n=1 Tax=Phalaenopsis equestris TaxID=78828 RepID=UPI0009E395C2|nr:WAT1-related protein At4g08300-like [Phalaenopsis equestris]